MNDVKLWYVNEWDVGDEPDPPTAMTAYVLATDYNALKVHATTMAIMLSRLIGTKDHVTHCDRTMGDSHPCTCGAQQAWHYLKTHAADPNGERT